MNKIKVYELDFGDTNFISDKAQDILDWIDSDMHDLKDEDSEGIQYTITTKLMTREEIDALPEWSFPKRPWRSVQKNGL